MLDYASFWMGLGTKMGTAGVGSARHGQGRYKAVRSGTFGADHVLAARSIVRLGERFTILSFSSGLPFSSQLQQPQIEPPKSKVLHFDLEPADG